MLKILLLLVAIIAIFLISVFIFYRIKFGYSPSPLAFKNQENCLRSIADTIPRYPNAQKWDIQSDSQQVGFEGHADASIQFFTKDDESTVFSYYKKRMVQDDWIERDNSVYIIEFPKRASHSLTFQKSGVIALSSPEGHQDASSPKGPAETEILRKDYVFRIIYCKAFR